MKPTGQSTHGARRYRAFISYSHAADSQLAPALQSSLQRFARPFYKLRALRLFRDKSSLELTPALWPLIRQALADSDFFVLLASPEAARSRWVQDEVEAWLGDHQGRAERLLILLTGGRIERDRDAGDFDWNQTTALPAALKGAFAEAPLFADLRWAKGADDLSLRNPQFLDEIATLAATLHGRPKDSLVGEDVRQHRRFKVAVTTVSLLLLILAAAASVASISATKSAREARRQARVALSRQLAAQAVNFEDRHLDLALLLAAQANNLTDKVEVRGSLLDVLLYSPHLKAFLGSQGAGINGLAFDAGGKVLASGDDAARVVLWEGGGRGRLGPPLLGHREAVTSVAFSPADGQLLASASADGSILLWDLVTRRPRHPPLLGHRKLVACLAFNPQGTILASGGADQHIRLWNVATGTPLAGFPPANLGAVRSVAFSPDGSLLASGGDAGDESQQPMVRLWNVGRRRPVGKPLAGHKEAVYVLAFSPDGRYLATGSYDGTVILWDVATRKMRGRPLSYHAGTVFALAFSPDGKLLASGGYDRRIALWDVATGLLIDRPAVGHRDRVFGLAFRRDGMLASGDGAGSLMLWDPLANHPLTRALTGRYTDADDVFALSFSPDARRIVTGDSRGQVILWDIPARRPAGPPLGILGSVVFTVAFSPDGNTVAAGSGNGVVQLWDGAVRHAILPSLVTGREAVRTVAFSPDGRLLAAAGYRFFQIWDVATRHQVAGPPLPAWKGVESLAFSPDGRRIALGGAEGVALWDRATRRELPALPAARKPFGVRVGENVTRVAWSPDGRILAAAKSDSTLVVWDTVARRLLGSPMIAQLANRQVYGLSFSPDGKTLVSSTAEGDVTLWDVATRQQIGQGFSGVGSCAVFSPDGRTLAASGGGHIYWEGPAGIGASPPGPEVNRPGLLLIDLELASWQRRARRMANRDFSTNERELYLASGF